MNNDEYLDKLGTAKWLLRDQPVDENLAEFYPADSTENASCETLRMLVNGRTDMEFVGVITCKSIGYPVLRTYAWLEMGAAGLQNIISLWGEKNKDNYPQIRKIIGTGTEKFMVLMEWLLPRYIGEAGLRLAAELGDMMGKDIPKQFSKEFNRKDEEMEKYGVTRLERWLKEHSCTDEHIEAVTDDQFLQLTNILNVNDIINTHIKKYHPAEIGRCADGHYLVLLDGGNNGQPHWHSYLEQIQSFLVRLHDSGYKAWVVEIENDCPDDTHQVILGIREAAHNQILEFTVKIDPKHIDTCRTYVYGWCAQTCMASDYSIFSKLNLNELCVQLIYKPGDWGLQRFLDEELHTLNTGLKALFGDKVTVSELKEANND